MKSKLILLLLISVGFWVRLYKIDNPVADWHSWRQADTASVTRNYVKQGIDLFHPRYDDFSDVSGKGLFNPDGYRFVEFPIYNLIHYFFFKIFGYFSLEIWGRLVTIISSLFSALLLYLIVKKRANSNLGLLTVFFFLFIPYNIYYSRVILPDPLMVTFFLSALYFVDINFILVLIFSVLAVLVKPVAIFFLLPLFWKLKISKKSFILLTTCLGIFGLWRLWSFQFPQGVPASGWLLNGNHIRFRPAFFGWIFHQRLGELILGIWGLPLLIIGFLNTLTSKYNYFFLWGIASIVYLFTFATGNVQHDYYQIAIIPSLAIFLALGFNHLWKFQNNLFYTWGSRLACIFCTVIMIYFGWYDVRGNGIKTYYHVNHWEIVHAGQAVDRLIPKDAIVAAPYGGDTAFLYQTNRKGFPVMAMPIKDLHDRFNVTYFVSTNFDAETNQIMDKYTVIEKQPEFVIVKLVEKPKAVK